MPHIAAKNKAKELFKKYMHFDGVEAYMGKHFISECVGITCNAIIEQITDGKEWEDLSDEVKLEIEYWEDVKREANQLANPYNYFRGD